MPPGRLTALFCELTAHKTADDAALEAASYNRKYRQPAKKQTLLNPAVWHVAIAIESQGVVNNFVELEGTCGRHSSLESMKIHAIDERWPLSTETLAAL